MNVVTKKLITAALAAVLLAVAAAPAPAHAKSCRPVLNMFDGSRLEGSDSYRIRATGVSCSTARRVARQGTRRAVAATPNVDGFVRVRYRRWRVLDDLRGSTDRFRARASQTKRISWLFGDAGR